MRTRRFEFSVTPLDPARVDSAQGIIYGVTIITSDVDAMGHDLRVDRTTLDQVKECAEAMGQVPVKWNHRTGADAVNGYLENFRIAGGKLLGDWYLLKSHDRFQQAMEMATRMPGNVGLSAAFLGEDEKRGGKLHEFGVGGLIVSSLLKTRKAWAPVGGAAAKAARAAAASPAGRFAMSAASSPGIAGTVGAVGGAVRAATDDDPETGVLGGAAKGAILGGAAGVLSGRVLSGRVAAGFSDPNQVRAEVDAIRRRRGL